MLRDGEDKLRGVSSLVLFRRDESRGHLFSEAARVGLIVLALTLCGQAQGQEESRQLAQSSQDQQEGRDPVAAGAGASPAIKADPPPCTIQGHPNAESPECREAVATEKGAVYARGAMFVGAFQAALLLGQIVALIVTIRQTRNAVTASQRSAKAAEDAVEKSDAILAHTQDSVRKQLRAYIHVDSAHVRYKSGAPSECYVEVRIKNYGQTPAHAVVSRFGEHVREWPLRTKLPQIPPIPVGVEPLPPGRQSIQRLPIGPLTPATEAALATGQLGIYFWGTVIYRDIFDEEHVTHIRLVCEGDGLRDGLMHACEGGNEST